MVTDFLTHYYETRKFYPATLRGIEFKSLLIANEQKAEAARIQATFKRSWPLRPEPLLLITETTHSIQAKLIFGRDSLGWQLTASARKGILSEATKENVRASAQAAYERALDDPYAKEFWVNG